MSDQKVVRALPVVLPPSMEIDVKATPYSG
jgi:hypothetical protein